MYDYFRAVLKSGEKSERVLELTEDGLDLNPANYTVWYYRYIMRLSPELTPQVYVGLSVSEPPSFCANPASAFLGLMRIWIYK